MAAPPQGCRKLTGLPASPALLADDYSDCIPVAELHLEKQGQAVAHTRRCKTPRQGNSFRQALLVNHWRPPQLVASPSVPAIPGLASHSLPALLPRARSRPFRLICWSLSEISRSECSSAAAKLGLLFPLKTENSLPCTHLDGLQYLGVEPDQGLLRLLGLLLRYSICVPSISSALLLYLL